MPNNYHPPYTITSTMIAKISDISELIGIISAINIPKLSPQLRKENRIKSITGTLAIEGNTLSVEQVSDIIEGKRVMGSVREIAEVHGAIAAYESLNRWNPVSSDNLLEAHKLLMGEILKNAGTYRKNNIGIHKGDEVVHVAPQPHIVPELMSNLLNWLEKCEEHPLISSSIFHYEFEFIHPFSDGNGRMGRLWQTLILSRYRDIFEFLPLESIIKEHQEGYYKALGDADSRSESTPFIEFMLEAIYQTLLKEKGNVPKNVPKNVPLNRLEKISVLIQKNKDITVDQLAKLCDVSSKTIKRDIVKLKNEGKIKRTGSLKSGYWEIQSCR